MRRKIPHAPGSDGHLRGVRYDSVPRGADSVQYRAALKSDHLQSWTAGRTGDLTEMRSKSQPFPQPANAAVAAGEDNMAPPNFFFVCNTPCL